MLDLVDELELANNAYRTKHYIVTQRIMFRQTEADGSMIMSMEVFYKRNQERDKIYARNERIYNRYEYCVLSLERERGTREGKPKKKKYYLSNYKIYRERFKTDCFADHFNALAEQSKIRLMDYICYASVKASVDELKQQNSYFINGLYGN